MHLHSFFLYYLVASRPLGYTLAFLGLMIEGDVTLFSIAFLTREGFFDVGDMLIIILLAVFIGDLLWYQAGKHLLTKFPKLSKLTERFSQPFEKQLTNNPARTLLVTKFTYGVHHAVLMRMGMLNVNFRQFIKKDIIAIIIWVAIIGGIGYFSAFSLEYLRKYMRYAEVSLLFGLLAFFAIEHLLKIISKKDL